MSKKPSSVSWFLLLAFIPMAYSQHGSQSKPTHVTTLLRHPFGFGSTLTWDKSQHPIMGDEGLHNLSPEHPTSISPKLLPLSPTSLCPTHTGLWMVLNMSGFSHHRAFARRPVRTESSSPGYLHAQSSASFSSLQKHCPLTEGPPGRPI